MAFVKRPKAPAFTTPVGTFKFPKISEVDYGNKEFPKPAGVYKLALILTAADPAVQAFVAKLEPYYQKALQNADTAFKALKPESRKKLGKVSANPLFTELLDQDTEEPTGEISFTFSTNASGEYKNGPKTGKFWDTRPTVFAKDTTKLIEGFNFRDRGTKDDGTEETMADVHAKVRPDIWGGTTGKVSFEVGITKDGEPGYFIAGTGAAGLSLKLRAVQVFDVVSGGQRTAADEGFANESGGEPEMATASADDADF